MLDYYITFRSITRAQRGSALFDDAGISNQLLRTPKAIATQGCGYALRVHQQVIYKAVQLLQQNEIAYQHVYRSAEYGQMEEYQI